MNRRQFLKYVAGLAAIPLIGKVLPKAKSMPLVITSMPYETSLFGIDAATYAAWKAQSYYGPGELTYEAILKASIAAKRNH